jgi:hypothetical protein
MSPQGPSRYAPRYGSPLNPDRTGAPGHGSREHRTVSLDSVASPKRVSIAPDSIPGHDPELATRGRRVRMLSSTANSTRSLARAAAATTVADAGPSPRTVENYRGMSVLDAAVPPVGAGRAAWNKVVYTFSWLTGLSREAKQERARGVVQWLRNQGFVEGERLRCEFTRGSRRLQEHRIREAFGWMAAWQVAGLTQMLAHRSARCGVYNHAADLPGLEDDVLYALYPRLRAHVSNNTRPRTR